MSLNALPVSRLDDDEFIALIYEFRNSNQNGLVSYKTFPKN